MISVTSAQLNAWLALFIWPFVRILGVIATDPVLGNRSVPARVKIGLAFLVTILLAPTLGPPPAVLPGSAEGILILMQQLVIGIAIGLVVRVVFTAAEMAGHMMGLQMGLGFATFFDPQNSAQVPLMAEFMGLFATLVFLAFNGHLMVIAALSESFRALPISAHPFAAGGWATLAQWGGEIFLAGLLIALPVLGALLITNMAIGIMTRAAPQLNIFAVGFPLTLAAGFVVLYLSLPYIMPLLERIWSDGLTVVAQVLQAAHSGAP